MRKGIILSNDWQHVGAILADSDDEDQVNFFRGFVKEMKTWDTGWAQGMQLAAIYKKLTDEEKKVLRSICVDEEDQICLT